MDMNGLRRFRAPMPQDTFLDVSSICFFHDKLLSMYTPSDFVSSTCLIVFPRLEFPHVDCFGFVISGGNLST